MIGTPAGLASSIRAAMLPAFSRPVVLLAHRFKLVRNRLFLSS